MENPGATRTSGDPPLSGAAEDSAAAAATRAGVRPVIDIAALEDEDGVAMAVQGQSMLTKLSQTGKFKATLEPASANDGD